MLPCAFVRCVTRIQIASSRPEIILSSLLSSYTFTCNPLLRFFTSYSYKARLTPPVFIFRAESDCELYSFVFLASGNGLSWSRAGYRFETDAERRRWQRKRMCTLESEWSTAPIDTWRTPNRVRNRYGPHGSGAGRAALRRAGGMLYCEGFCAGHFPNQRPRPHCTRSAAKSFK